VRSFRGADEYGSLVSDARDAFFRADIPEVIRVLDRGFGRNIYSLKSLFRDEQRRILDDILNSTVEEAEAVYRQLYEHHAPLLRFLVTLGLRLPKALRTTAEYALNSRLRLAFAADPLDPDRIRTLLEEARLGQTDLDAATLEYTLRLSVEKLARRFRSDPENLETLEALAGVVGLIPGLPFQLTLWNVQNAAYTALVHNLPAMASRAERSDSDAVRWTAEFREMARILSLQLS
jgi:hypothetical protein